MNTYLVTKAGVNQCYIDAESDQLAVMAARKLVEGRFLKLWDGFRLVAVLDAPKFEDDPVAVAERMIGRKTG